MSLKFAPGTVGIENSTTVCGNISERGARLIFVYYNAHCVC